MKQFTAMVEHNGRIYSAVGDTEDDARNKLRPKLDAIRIPAHRRAGISIIAEDRPAFTHYYLPGSNANMLTIRKELSDDQYYGKGEISDVEISAEDAWKLCSAFNADNKPLPTNIRQKRLIRDALEAFRGKTAYYQESEINDLVKTLYADIHEYKEKNYKPLGELENKS